MSPHAGAEYHGTPRRPNQWRAIVYTEAPGGRSVLWRGTTTWHGFREAQAEAEAELAKRAAITDYYEDKGRPGQPPPRPR